MDKVRIHWATATTDSQIGNVYGYRTHNDTLRRYAEPLAEITPDAKNMLLITVPEFYPEKVPDKITFLFTMFEGMTLPEVYAKNVQNADFLITPSTFVKDIFSPYFDPNKIFIVHHGVEPVYSYRKRNYNKFKKFRYLWVGAPNPRKGWQELAYVWDRVGFKNDPGCELYIKTTNLKTKWPIEQRLNVILDNRNLSKEDLVKLYHSAHCFVFPTRGEGFGLTLAEAMRTGLPCIATNFSGLTDFFNGDVGYPIPYKIAPGKVSSPVLGDLGEIDIAYADVKELVDRMVYVREHWKKAVFKGLKGSILIRKAFTWERAANTLVNIIRENGDNGNSYNS